MNGAERAFLGIVSHEVRNPMNGVLGMLQALEGTDLSDDQREFVTTARSSGEETPIS